MANSLSLGPMNKVGEREYHLWSLFLRYILHSSVPPYCRKSIGKLIQHVFFLRIVCNAVHNLSGWWLSCIVTHYQRDFIKYTLTLVLLTIFVTCISFARSKSELVHVHVVTVWIYPYFPFQFSAKFRDVMGRNTPHEISLRNPLRNSLHLLVRLDMWLNWLKSGRKKASPWKARKFPIWVDIPKGNYIGLHRYIRIRIPSYCYCSNLFAPPASSFSVRQIASQLIRISPQQLHQSGSGEMIWTAIRTVLTQFSPIWSTWTCLSDPIRSDPGPPIQLVHYNILLRMLS